MEKASLRIKDIPVNGKLETRTMSLGGVVVEVSVRLPEPFPDDPSYRFASEGDENARNPFYADSRAGVKLLENGNYAYDTTVSWL